MQRIHSDYNSHCIVVASQPGTDDRPNERLFKRACLNIIWGGMTSNMGVYLRWSDGEVIAK